MDALRPLFAEVARLASSDDIIVIAGSLPVVEPANRQELIDELARIKGALVLDTTSLNLDELRQVAPRLVKLNRGELQALLPSANTEEDIVGAVAKAREATGAAIVVTDGPGPAYSLDQQGRSSTYVIADDWHAEAASLIGSGDAFLAGFISAADEGQPLELCVVRGLCFGIVRQTALSLTDVDFSPARTGQVVRAISIV